MRMHRQSFKAPGIGPTIARISVFGTHGYIFTPDARNVRLRLQGEATEKAVALAELDSHYDNCFAYLAAVVRGDVECGGDRPLSLTQNNLIVVRILDAARLTLSRRTIILDS